ncbi:MAG: rhodanese-like domain-containing protein [Planctomycetes bacterium]|jgi:rhodanese-related sulfurtransferase|nr:rhodanese-like domain-containing protein [Planctomycetota bacterium]
MTNNKTISTSELQQLNHGKTDFLLLDVLPKAQFDQDHIEGARNVPFDSTDFVAAAGRAAGSKTRKVVVYCSGTGCSTSGKAAAALTAAGHSDVRTYEGGLEAWRAEKKQAAGKADDHGAAPAAPRAATKATEKPTEKPHDSATGKPAGKPSDKPATVNTGGSAGAHPAPAREGKVHKAGGAK